MKDETIENFLTLDKLEEMTDEEIAEIVCGASKDMDLVHRKYAS